MPSVSCLAWLESVGGEFVLMLARRSMSVGVRARPAKERVVVLQIQFILVIACEFLRILAEVGRGDEDRLAGAVVILHTQETLDDAYPHASLFAVALRFNDEFQADVIDRANGKEIHAAIPRLLGEFNCVPKVVEDAFKELFERCPRGDPRAWGHQRFVGQSRR